MRNPDMSLPALRRKLATAEKRLKRLKDRRPSSNNEIRRSDRRCRKLVYEIIEQMEKVERLTALVVAAESCKEVKQNERKIEQ